MKSVSLIGMSGSGKSTTGPLVASILNMGFADVDFLIEKQEGRTISEIFELHGEEYFRKIEAGIIQSLIGENLVISTGGGAFENENTRRFLLDNTYVIYLETSASEVYSRLCGINDRPLLKEMTPEKIEKMLSERKKHYEFAHYKILTDNKSPQQVAQEIVKCLN